MCSSSKRYSGARTAVCALESGASRCRCRRESASSGYTMGGLVGCAFTCEIRSKARRNLFVLILYPVVLSRLGGKPYCFLSYLQTCYSRHSRAQFAKADQDSPTLEHQSKIYNLIHTTYLHSSPICCANPMSSCSLESVCL